MAYFCRDCSYSGKKPSSEGKCPACGSSKFGSAKAGSNDKKLEGSSPLKLAVLVGLWAWLIFEIHRKLNAL